MYLSEYGIHELHAQDTKRLLIAGCSTAVGQ